MTLVRTIIGTEESARRQRVEKTGAITQTNVQKALETLDTGLTTLGATVGALSIGARPQRSVTGAGGLPVQAGDAVLNLTLSAPLVIPLPAATGRLGAPLTFVDTGRNFSTNNVTLNRAGADTIEGLTSLVLNVDDQVLTLVPYNDGVNSGWKIQ